MEEMHSKKIFLCAGMSAFSPVEKTSLRYSAMCLKAQGRNFQLLSLQMKISSWNAFLPWCGRCSAETEQLPLAAIE